MRRLLCALAVALASPALMLVQTAGAANAGPSSYYSEIEEFRLVDEVSSGHFAQEAMSSPIAIDRKTGRVVHPWVGNTSFLEVILINRGSDSWSFRSVAHSGPAGPAAYYEVKE